MSEKNFIPEGFREFFYNPINKAEIGSKLQENGKISSATRTILTNYNSMYNFDRKTLENCEDFLSFDKSSDFKTKIEKLDSFLKNNRNDLVDSGRQIIILSLLLAKLDLLERSDYSNNQIYHETKNNIDSYFKSIFNNYEASKTHGLINDPIFNLYIGVSMKSEGEPSQYFIKSFLKNYKDKFGIFPEIGDFGNIYCVLLSTSKKENLDFVEQNITAEDLFGYSSNAAHKLPLKENRKSTLFEERANGTENTSIERGNLNYISELVRYYIVSNHEIEYNKNAIHKYEDCEGFNSHFFKILEKLNDYILQNKNKQEKIKEINYMPNCPISIIPPNEFITLADFVKNEIKFNEKLTEEQKATFKKFAGIMDIEKNQELNINELKLMTAEEAVAQYGSKIEKEVKATPEFMLAAYGFKSIKQEELKKITIDEKIFKLLSERNFQNFNGLTLTPDALQVAKNTNNSSLSLDDIKIETRGQKVSEDIFITMYSHGFTDFSGATFVGYFSDDSKQKIAEITGLSEASRTTMELSNKIGIFTSKNKIEQITESFDKVFSIIDKFKPDNFLADQDELNKAKLAIEKYSKSNLFMRIFRRKNVRNSIKKFSKTMNFMNNIDKNQKNMEQFSKATIITKKQEQQQTLTTHFDQMKTKNRESNIEAPEHRSLA